MPGSQENANARFDLTNQTLKNDTVDHKQRVEAIIKNINTLASEVKKMKDLLRMGMRTAATAKGNGTDQTSLDQSELTAGAGEKSISNGTKLYYQEGGQ